MTGPNLIPHLVVNDGHAAVRYYEQAFGAVAVSIVPAPDGKRLMHASLKIGEGILMLNDDFPEYSGGKSRTPKALGGTPVTLHLNVPDCDAAVAKAVAAGGVATMPPMDMFWGDRYGKLLDPFGHEWSFSHPLSPEKAQAAAEVFQKQGGFK